MSQIVTLGFVAALVMGAAVVPLTAQAAPKTVSRKPPTAKAPAKKAPSVKAPVQPGTLGTTQMAGGDGRFGQTYTFTDAGQFGPINMTLKSAEYSVERINMATNDSYAPKVGEKLLVLHYRIKNPNKEDLYYTHRPLFQTVDGDNTTRDDAANSRRESAREGIGVSLKPGQGIDDLLTYAVVSAKGPLPKLILKLFRVGTHDEVTRFPLGAAPNLVKPIPAPYADPSDPTGATPLAVIPATLGTAYIAGFFDMSLDSAAYAPGPFGDTAADDGKRFLVATVTATNRAWDKIYFKDNYAVTLVTSDDEKTTDYTAFKAKRDESFDGEEVLPGASRTLRLLFQVPKDVTVKSLSLAEKIDNSGGLSRAFLYDLSGIK